MRSTGGQRTQWMELADKATRGPWIEDAGELSYQGAVSVKDPSMASGFRRVAYCGAPSGVARKEEHRANALFIVACREAVPALLDDIDYLLTLLSMTRKEHVDERGIYSCITKLSAIESCDCGAEDWNAKIEALTG